MARREKLFQNLRRSILNTNTQSMKSRHPPTSTQDLDVELMNLTFPKILLNFPGPLRFFLQAKNCKSADKLLQKSSDCDAEVQIDLIYFHSRHTTRIYSHAYCLVFPSICMTRVRYFYIRKEWL